MSIAGGLDLAVDRAKQAGCHALQIFTKSSGQWRARDLPADEISRFRSRVRDEGLRHVAAHASYLINLASPDAVLQRRSIDALGVEIARADTLGISSLILHPGAHMGRGLDEGIKSVAMGLNSVFASAPKNGVRLLLETWAGQGTTIGSRFEEIAGILDRVRASHRLGVCFDTCHVFAAGYELRTEREYAATFRAFERTIGVDRIEAFHLNDSKNDLGRRLDRHEHIGRGWIGLEAFRLLLNDPRFVHVPMYLETPKGKDLAEDLRNLKTLRKLVGCEAIQPWAPPGVNASSSSTGEARPHRGKALQETRRRGVDEAEPPSRRIALSRTEKAGDRLRRQRPEARRSRRRP